MSASTLFDKLRQEKGIPSDAALARELKVSQCVLSQARRKGRISDGMILRVVEYSNWRPAEVRVLLGQMDLHQYHDNPAQVSATEASQ
jgi:hypothetical protein